MFLEQLHHRLDALLKLLVRSLAGLCRIFHDPVIGIDAVSFLEPPPVRCVHPECRDGYGSSVYQIRLTGMLLSSFWSGPMPVMKNDGSFSDSRKVYSNLVGFLLEFLLILLLRLSLISLLFGSGSVWI